MRDSDRHGGAMDEVDKDGARGRSMKYYLYGTIDL